MLYHYYFLNYYVLPLYLTLFAQSPELAVSLVCSVDPSAA